MRYIKTRSYITIILQPASCNSDKQRWFLEEMGILRRFMLIQELLTGNWVGKLKLL